VAYSGGVDSAVVAKAARLALGDAAVVVTGASASLADGELEEAQHVAELIGVRHVVVQTSEFDNPNYVANAPDRCYHCKTELYGELQELAKQLGMAVLVNGANVDDLDDYRPGMQAASEFRVRSPLAECGFNKQEIRQLAADWHLPVADKPATPCLSSRVAHGEEVTPERLRMIDAAEQVLRSFGISNLRVRYHTGDVARIEMPLEELCNCCDPLIRTVLVEELRELGFKFVTIDLEGYRPGGLTQLVSADSLVKPS
jgi:uncharacterized protein